jgi:hypothetical protein
LGVSVLVLLPAVTVLPVLMLLFVRRNVNADVEPCCWVLTFSRWSTPSIVRFFCEFALEEDPVVDFPDLLPLLLVDPMDPVSSEDTAFAC